MPIPSLFPPSIAKTKLPGSTMPLDIPLQPVVGSTRAPCMFFIRIIAEAGARFAVSARVRSS